MASRSIAEGLFEPGTRPPHLYGGRHRETGRHVFPMPVGAEGDLYDRVPLRSEGKLWSWTIQRFRPKSPPYTGPDPFEPFAVGYIELPGQVIIETRLTNVDFAALRIGDAYRMTVIEFGQDPDGADVLTYAFEPARGAGE